MKMWPMDANYSDLMHQPHWLSGLHIFIYIYLYISKLILTWSNMFRWTWLLQELEFPFLPSPTHPTFVAYRMYYLRMRLLPLVRKVFESWYLSYMPQECASQDLCRCHTEQRYWLYNLICEGCRLQIYPPFGGPANSSLGMTKIKRSFAPDWHILPFFLSGNCNSCIWNKVWGRKKIWKNVSNSERCGSPEFTYFRIRTGSGVGSKLIKHGLSAALPPTWRTQIFPPSPLFLCPSRFVFI